MRNGRITGLTAVLVGAALGAVAAVGDGVERFPDGSVSVHAVEAPLGSLLRQVARRALVDPEVESRGVSVDLDRRPVAEALQAIVSAASVSYILYGDAVYVGERSMALAAQEQAAARQPAEEPGAGEDMDSPEWAAERKERLRREAAKPSPPMPPARTEEPSGSEDPALEAAAEESALDSQQQSDLLLRAMSPPVPGGAAEQAVMVPVPTPDGESMTETWVTRREGGVVTLPFVGPDGSLRAVPVDPWVRPLNPLEALPPAPAGPPPPDPPRIDPDGVQTP